MLGSTKFSIPMLHEPLPLEMNGHALNLYAACMYSHYCMTITYDSKNVGSTG